MRRVFGKPVLRWGLYRVAEMRLGLGSANAPLWKCCLIVPTWVCERRRVVAGSASGDVILYREIVADFRPSEGQVSEQTDAIALPRIGLSPSPQS
jgi:hypothetical protein